MSDILTHAMFEDCVGQSFRLYDSEIGELSLELIEATVKPAGGRDDAREPFSLVFRGPSDCNPPQQIYRLEHDKLGSLDLFLVPVGPDDSGMCLEAVFA